MLQAKKHYGAGWKYQAHLIIKEKWEQFHNVIQWDMKSMPESRIFSCEILRTYTYRIKVIGPL